jgi:Icc-related predicted phosphoesterase
MVAFGVIGPELVQEFVDVISHQPGQVSGPTGAQRLATGQSMWESPLVSGSPTGTVVGRITPAVATKFIITADLHQSIGKWRDLVRVVEQDRPRFVLVAGDLLPKDGGFHGQRKFFAVLEDYLCAMRGSGNTTVLTFFGNDDFHPLEPLLDDLAAKKLCVNLNGKIHREAGLVFCGMNYVRDYPFGYKHWCAPDGDFVACPVQFCGQGLTLDANGRWVKLPNLREYLLAKPSLSDRLEALRSQLTPEEVPGSVWLVHCPPADLGMDICYDGDQVGSPTITRFIEKLQPLLGCSGHIHESPYQPGGKWAARVGSTAWFQPGQEGQRLHYVSLEVDDNLGIGACGHSIFGAGTI